MSLKSLVNGLAVAALASATLVPLAGPAEARDGHRGRSGGWGHDSGHRADAGHGRGGDHRGHGWRHGRSHRGEAIAIGTFAAVLGLALAAQSQRVQEEYYDERD